MVFRRVQTTGARGARAADEASNGRFAAHFPLDCPFRFKPITGRLPRERLRQMTDEAMYVLAAMLPEHRRGYYADLPKAMRETIERAVAVLPSFAVTNENAPAVARVKVLQV